MERQIKEVIFKKRFPVGTKLPTERQLAEMIQVSRTSVREALRSMERSGFITIKKGAQGGAFLSRGRPKHIVESMIDLFESRHISLEEILQARLLIEPPVAAEAAMRAASEDIERLKEANQMLGEGYKRGDMNSEYNPRIHRIIAEMSRNRVIVMIVQVLIEVHTQKMRSIRVDDQSNEEILEQHEGIIDTMVKRDSKLAFERMRNHILRVHEIHKSIEEGGALPLKTNEPWEF